MLADNRVGRRVRVASLDRQSIEIVEAGVVVSCLAPQEALEVTGDVVILEGRAQFGGVGRTVLPSPFARLVSKPPAGLFVGVHDEGEFVDIGAPVAVTAQIHAPIVAGGL